MDDDVNVDDDKVDYDVNVDDDVPGTSSCKCRDEDICVYV